MAPSFDGTNVGPRIGPVVINEIMYHPELGGDEFIELRNITGNPVALFNEAVPTNTWRLNGAGFNFPTNITLGNRREALFLTHADRKRFLGPVDELV